MLTVEQFEQVYNEHKNLVFNMSLHYVLNPDDAADITQEVFVKVHQRYHQFDSKTASLKTWICQIAINHSLDYLKSKKTKKRFGFMGSLFHPETNEPVETTIQVNHPGIAAEDKEGLQTLLQIIYALPENQKTAIILSKIEDRPQREVAEIMNTSVKAVESLIQRAKQTIQKKLTETEGF